MDEVKLRKRTAYTLDRRTRTHAFSREWVTTPRTWVWVCVSSIPVGIVWPKTFILKNRGKKIVKFTETKRLKWEKKNARIQFPVVAKLEFPLLISFWLGFFSVVENFALKSYFKRKSTVHCCFHYILGIFVVVVVVFLRHFTKRLYNRPFRLLKVTYTHIDTHRHTSKNQWKREEIFQSNILMKRDDGIPDLLMRPQRAPATKTSV